MSEIGKGAVDAEKELRSAVERISKGVRSIEEFSSASTTLGKVSQENLELAERLREIAREVDAGARKLSDAGIAEFNETLSSSIASLRATVSVSLKAEFKKVTSTLEAEQKGVNRALEDSLSKKVEGLASELDRSIKQVQTELNNVLEEKSAAIEAKIAQRTKKLFLAMVILSSVGLLGVGILLYRMF